MPKPYSADLRERVLLAGEAGLPSAIVARHFGVGLSTVYLWRQQARAEGRPHNQEEHSMIAGAGHSSKLFSIQAARSAARCPLIEMGPSSRVIAAGGRLRLSSAWSSRTIIPVWACYPLYPGRPPAAVSP